MADSKTDIVLGELSSFADKRSVLAEKQIAYVGELAELLSEEAGEEEIFFRDESFVARYRALTALPPLSSVMPENAFRVRKQEASLSVMQRAWLCGRLCQILGIEGMAGIGTFFDETPMPPGQTVSYLKSSYADEAYVRFSSLLTDAKVLYGDDFAEVCENVYYGRCAYGILPFENSTDGRLAGFRALIVKYGLKIVGCCRVAIVGDEETVFALVTRTLLCPQGEGAVFDLRVTCGEGLLSLLTAADACGMVTRDVVSVPGGRGSYDLTLSVDPDGICGFLAFLHFEYPLFTPIGIYTEIG